MNKVTPELDLRSSASILAYLTEHSRYSTMGTNNRATSFSQCVKIHSLGLEDSPQIQALDARYGPGTGLDTAYAMLDLANFWDVVVQPSINKFTKKMDYRYSIAANGRSSGYLVLYRFERKPSEWQSVCRTCRQRNYRRVTDAGKDSTDNKCGACGAVGLNGRINYETPPLLESFLPTSIGQDLDELTGHQRKELAKTVKAFDATCLEIKKRFISLIVANKVKRVPKVVSVKTEVSRLMPR